MPRGTRLDGPGILHHVWARGIERGRIFIDDNDRRDFLRRLADACEGGRAEVYAWCLMDNHVHLSIRTGSKPISNTVSRVLSGYAVAFNLRHKRSGHLFQNRFKSAVVDDERYFLGLMRYIHLNPLRAGIVNGLEELSQYPWTGHAALLGRPKEPFHQVEEVLLRFGNDRSAARRELMSFMGHSDAEKEARIFRGAGGGLVRSLGGMSEVMEPGKQEKTSYDDRILGSGEFVERILERTQAAPKGLSMTEEQRWEAYDTLVNKACARAKIDQNELCSGSRRRPVSIVRQVVAYLSSRKLGLSCAAVARTMNITTPAATQAAEKGEQTLKTLGWEENELLTIKT